MGFRGSSDKLYMPDNGKFFGLVQLFAKFDPVIEEHVSLATRGEISDHYCGKTIQNELINLLAEKVLSMIKCNVFKAIYYAIIADSTTYISHKEQPSLTIRFVNITDDEIKVKEHFLEFCIINGSTGAGLTEIITGILDKHGFELKNCRGQGYDNGANMKGIHNGVQKRILDQNPLALFLPCGCHNLNLLLCDAVQTSIKSITLFGILQRLFTLFSGSAKCWTILTEHVKIFSKKTQWY